MACRSTGWCMLASESVEMVQYNALVAHLVSMERRVPVQHFFDGFRTSHEVNKVRLIDYNSMKQFINWDAVKEHHDLAMNPRHPHVQGTSQGPDIFFQCVEAGNVFYDNLADLFEAKSRLVEQKTGVHYALYAYEGHAEAEYVIVVMGSGAVTCSETAKYLQEKGEKVGVLKVRLFRPWDRTRFMAALPKTTKRVCVLDRTKDWGSQGEPLLLEVSATFQFMSRPDIICIGGRYGLGSKEFTPNMYLINLISQDMTRYMKPNGVCVINCSWSVSELESKLPAKMRRDLASKKAKLYIIDATQIAVKAGLGKRINMIMQSVFFKLSGVMPFEEAIEMLKKSIKKMYGKKGDKVVQMNIDGVDASVSGIIECPVPAEWANLTVPGEACCDVSSLERLFFTSRVRPGMRHSQFEKRGIAINVPKVDMDLCTQCNKCSLICPHAAVRPFLATQMELNSAPKDFKDGSRAAIGDRGDEIDKTTVKGSQFQKPYLEFSGACEGCGETPHVKLMTQLFGERLVIANATGCSSIWGGSNPSFPYTQGSTWAREASASTAGISQKNVLEAVIGESKSRL
eukprot:g24936.t1